MRWHRAGFSRYWRWKSHAQGGRPQIDTDLRALIRRMSGENPLWGAPRIHGELLKLGFKDAQSSIAKYMAERLAQWQPGKILLFVVLRSLKRTTKLQGCLRPNLCNR